MAKKLIAVVVTVVIVVGLAAGVAWLFMSGKLTWNAGGTQPATVSIVCGDDIVTSFNQARDASIREEGGVETSDVEGQKKIAQDVRTMSGYEKDPTCQTIALWGSFLDGNYEATKTAYEALVSLHDQHIYANNNLSGVEKIDTYRVMTEGLSPENFGKGTNGDQ